MISSLHIIYNFLFRKANLLKSNLSKIFILESVEKSNNRKIFKFLSILPIKNVSNLHFVINSVIWDPIFFFQKHLLNIYHLFFTSLSRMLVWNYESERLEFKKYFMCIKVNQISSINLKLLKIRKCKDSILKFIKNINTIKELFQNESSSFFLKVSVDRTIIIIKKSMCKKNFITLKKQKKLYKIFSEDIQAIYKNMKKKTPFLPSFDMPTSDESFCLGNP